jgi:signal transduction histidine kinase
MERAEALKLLGSKTADDRLRAARCLSRRALQEDVLEIQNALSIETHRWVKSALKKALASIQTHSAPVAVEIGPEGEDERILEQIRAEAVEDTAKQFLHEIRPIVGRLDVSAAAEIPNYEQSETRAEWLRLQSLLNAIDELSQAASAPIYKEFDLAGLLDQIVTLQRASTDTRIECAGPKPFLLLGASNLIELIVSNALRNAVEASDQLPTKEAIVVNWDRTERDYWIAVIDSGRGLPSTTHRMFEIGTTNKKDHLGMGLALAMQAAMSLNGKITLAPREQGGARFEFRWPRISL